MNLTCLFLGIVFCLVGALFACGKIHSYMKSWKIMPLAKRREIRIQPLVLNIGLVIMLNGCLFVAKGCFAGFTNRYFTLAMALWFCLAGIDFWYIGKSQRYLNQ